MASAAEEDLLGVKELIIFYTLYIFNFLNIILIFIKSYYTFLLIN